MAFEYAYTTKHLALAASGSGFTGGLSLIAIVAVAAIFGIVSVVAVTDSQERQRELER